MRRICPAFFPILTLAACIASTTAPATSAEPTKLKVIGSHQSPPNSAVDVKVDELVTLKIDTDANAQVVIFAVPELQFSRNRAGTSISFYAKPGRYTFCFAAFVAGKSPSKSQYVVQAGDNPNPPDPTPPRPDGIAGEVYDAALKVNSDTRQADAKQIANVLRSLSAKAAAVSTVTLNDMKSELKTTLVSSLSDGQKKAWSDWSKAFNEILKKHATTKPLAIKTLNDSATGLEAVR